MKLFNKYMFVALAGCLASSVVLTSCEEEADEYAYTPAEKLTNAQVFFSNTLPTSYTLSSLENSFNVTISRSTDAEAVSVPVQVTADAQYFTVPATVSFAAGSKTADLTIGYDADKLGFDNKQSISVVVPSESATPYGISEYNFSVVIPAPWKSLGQATIVDDFVTTFYGVENVSWQVEIEENEMFPGYYRLVNPYCENYPYNEPGDWDTSTDFYLEIHAEDPNKVYIPTQVSNTVWSYGNFIFGSLAGYYLAKGDEASAAPYYGTLEGGIISFPANALLFGMSDYNNGGLYTSNSNGAFKVVMPGIVLADYSAEITYGGKMYDAEDKLYIVANAEFGADVEEMKLAVCAAGQEEALLEEILGGESESVVTLSQSGSANLPFDAAAASGKYTIVGVTFAGGEAQELSTATFKYTSLNGEPAESWTAYYVGTATYNCLWEEPESDTEVVLYASDDDATGVRCKVAPWINSEEGMIFSWPEEGAIEVLAEQETGLQNQNGLEILVAGLEQPCSLAGGEVDWATFIKANFASYLSGDEDTPSSFVESSYLFSFNVVYYTEAGNIYGWGFDTYQLTGQAGARAAIAGLPSVAAVPAGHVSSLSRVKLFDQPLVLKATPIAPKSAMVLR